MHFYTENEEKCTSLQMNRQIPGNCFQQHFIKRRISCSSWSTAMLQSTSASSWDAGCWCGRTSSCGSWRHVGADGRNTWERTSSSSTHDLHQRTSARLYQWSVRSYLRQIIFSQLYFWASCLRDGSMMPPLRRSTRWRVDSENKHKHHPINTTALDQQQVLWTREWLSFSSPSSI